MDKQQTLPKEFLDKSLYLCCLETYRYKQRPAIHAIGLVELLTSSSPSKCRTVARFAVEDLPTRSGKSVPWGACGVSGGSKIIFAGDPFVWRCPPVNPVLETYAFSIHDSNKGISMLPGKLKAGKFRPLMPEVAGELYILGLQYADSFEVYHSESGTWSDLPPYPIKNTRGQDFSYAVAGGKLFVSTFATYGIESEHSLYCFDPKKEKPEWRRVDTMGPRFPFEGEALVLDLPDPNKKLLFTSTVPFQVPRLVVYLMSLDENKESLAQISEMNLPALFPGPHGFTFFHLGGNNVCFVTSSFWDYDQPVVTHIMRGAAVPFQFEFDISKVGMEDCFTVQLQAPRIFEYDSSSDPHQVPLPIGCFLL